MSTRRNAVYNVAYRVFSILLPLVTAPYLSRTVGQQGVGLYSYAWSISEVFVIIGMLGLENYGVRAIAKARSDRDSLDRVFSEIFRMQWLVAGIVLAVWLAYVLLVAGEERLIAAHLTMMSISCLVNLDWCLMGLDEFKPIALRNTCVKLAAAGCVFLFVHSPQDLWIYAMVWSGATLVGCLLCWPSLRGRVRLIRVPFPQVLQHIGPCAVLLISVLAVRVYRTMDKVMLGAMAGMAENGLYENAEKIIYCLSGFIAAIGTVMMPGAARLIKEGQRKAVIDRMDTTMQLMLCMTSAMAFGLCAVARSFAPLFYGDDFARSGDLMRMLAFTLILIGWANVIRTQWVLPQERDRVFVVSVVCGAVINVVANSLLIPVLKADGAVIGTLLAETAVPVVQFIYLRRELPYRRYLRYAMEYLCMGAVMAMAVRGAALLPLSGWLLLAVQALIGAAVYGILCLMWWRVTGNKALLRLIPVRRLRG